MTIGEQLIQMFIKISQFNWINVSEGISFRLIEEFTSYLIIFIGIFLGYLLIKPMTSWLVSLKLVRLLSYLMSSLLIFVLLLLFILTIEGLNHFPIHLFKIFLQCLASFGVTLVLFKVFRGGEKSYRKD